MKTSIRSTLIRLGLSMLAPAVLLLSATFFVAPVATAQGLNAPTSSLNGAIDIDGLYLFRDPSGCSAAAAGCNLVVAMTVQPGADPSFALAYHFQPNAIYRINFSTTPDAITSGQATASIDFVFSPFGNNSTCPAPNPPCQTYTATFSQGTVVQGLTTQGSASATPHPAVITQAGPISMFAGPREEPFFFDLVGFERFIADFNAQTAPTTPHFTLFTGRDAYLGKNVDAIVAEFPVSMLLDPGSTKLAAWAVTFLVPPQPDLPPGGKGSNGKPFSALGPQQTARLGNPIVNLSLISEPLKDAFNFGLPQNDAGDFGAVITGNIIRYGVDQTNILPVLATAIIPDTLKFDTTLPDGYLQVPPNGRQLQDRTTDFLFTLFFNVQGGPGTQHPGSVTCPQLAETPFSDCTNPKVYLSVFPFLGPPLQPAP